MAKLSLGKKTGIGAGVASAILAAVLSVEGGYVNDPRDPGGETNHGITQKVALAQGYTQPMKDMPVEVAEAIYYEDYIRKPGYEPMLTLSPAVAEELIDSGVNTGTSRSSLWFQKALNSLNRNGQDFPTINTDGKVGTNTINSYKSLQKKRGRVSACELTLKLLDAQQANHYMSLTKLGTYMPGWIGNRIGNVPLSRCKEEAK